MTESLILTSYIYFIILYTEYIHLRTYVFVHRYFYYSSWAVSDNKANSSYVYDFYKYTYTLDTILSIV